MKTITKSMLKSTIKNCLEHEQITTEALMKEMFESLLEIERDQFLGYPSGEREKMTSNKRNGYYERVIKNLQGAFNIRVPRDRHGDFIPVTLELLKKNEEDLKFLGYKLYAKGMSTRDISDVFEDVFKTSYNPQNISNITKEFEVHRKQWQEKLLDSDYYFIYIDAIHTKIRRATVSNEAIYVLIGLKTNLERDVLGIYCIPQESASGWEDVLRDIEKRGVRRFIMCIADGLNNLETALSNVYPKAMLQKCVVHKIRNILLKVRSQDKEHIANDLSHIFDLDNPNHSLELGKERIKNFLDKWKNSYPYLYRKFDEQVIDYYFQYLKFPLVIRRLIYTTNWIERLNKHLRKVEKNKNSFPNEDSAINLLYMAVIEFEEKVYKYKVSSFETSKEDLNLMLSNLYPFQTQNF